MTWVSAWKLRILSWKKLSVAKLLRQRLPIRLSTSTSIVKIILNRSKSLHSFWENILILVGSSETESLWKIILSIKHISNSELKRQLILFVDASTRNRGVSKIVNNSLIQSCICPCLIWFSISTMRRRWCSATGSFLISPRSMSLVLKREAFAQFQLTETTVSIRN